MNNDFLNMLAIFFLLYSVVASSHFVFLDLGIDRLKKRLDSILEELKEIKEMEKNHEQS